jgi:hypothetical protein
MDRMADFTNIQVTKLIKAGGRLREFNFRYHPGPSGRICNVDVPDDTGNRYYLSYYQKEGKWVWEKTVLPKWIQDIIPQLQEAVESTS